MKTTTYIITGLFAAMVWLAGCTTSPEDRINRSPEVFAQLPAEQQALVKEGKVGIGFGPDAVRLAVGKPDRIWTRTSAEGASEVWSYTTWQTDLGEPLYQGWYHRAYPGLYPLYFSRYPTRREYEYFKVVFGPDNKVVAVERDARR